MIVRRVSRLLVALCALSLVATAPALASLGGEVAAGQAVAAELRSGAATCTSLSGSEFEHLGEYVMDRMVGSRAVHTAMNARMVRMMGADRTDRMHEALGRSYAGCANGAGSAAPMGPHMMNGAGTYGARPSWGAMMSSPAWSWMHDGTWQHMSRARWQGLAANMMGGDRTVGHHRGTSTALWVVLAALLFGGLAALIAMRRPWRGRPST